MGFLFASRRRMRNLIALGLAAAACIAAGLFLQFGALAQGTLDGPRAPVAEAAPEPAPTPSIVRTDSPRQTLASFLRLRDELEAALGPYRQETTLVHAVRLAEVTEQMRSLFDFSAVPVASRQQVGGETGAYVLDILGRIGLPNLDEVPDLAAVEAEGLTRYVIPDTPLRITRIEEGPRAGEFLFSAQTVDTAPRFYRGIATLPLRSSLPIESWISEVRQLTGPMIPAVLVAAVPDFMKQPVLGTPIWKILAVILIVLLAAFALAFLHKGIAASRPGRKRAALWRQTLSPLAIIAATFFIWRFSAVQINVSGRFAWALDVAMTTVGYLGLAWAIWLVSLALFETIVRSKDFPEENLDANMLRLVARIVGVVGIIVVLATGAQVLGLPVVSVLAGLGIGGLAVALAIRPTLENLIGGFILYLDKPVRVGDFCNFGTQSGTVERIGVRSTQIRALDRTLITVPNAQFADMQIVNWARCDQMLIEQVVGLRYETSGDQLRFVLARIREMFHAHPRIDDETVRVRLATYGPSSLDILIRVYAKTREWNDFFAVKEDVLLRIKEIVEQSGTSFALPSQTLYLGKDGGLDEALSVKAVQQVAAWRRTGRLPFPRFAAGALEKLAGSLSYPPRGSPDFNATEEELAEAGDERLSAEPLQRESAVPTEAKAQAQAPEDAQKRV